MRRHTSAKLTINTHTTPLSSPSLSIGAPSPLATSPRKWSVNKFKAFDTLPADRNRLHDENHSISFLEYGMIVALVPDVMGGFVSGEGFAQLDLQVRDEEAWGHFRDCLFEV